MKIREAEKYDAKKLLDLFKKLDNESSFMLFEPEERKTDLSQQENIIENSFSASNWVMLVAENETSIVGVCVIMGGKCNRTLHCASLSMGVEKSFWGKGVGSSLVEKALEKAKSAGILRIELTVHTTNNRAIELYKKYGFAIEGERERSLKLGEELVNEYYMAKV